MAINTRPFNGVAASANVPVSYGWPVRYRVQNTAAAAGKTQIACNVTVKLGILTIGTLQVTPLLGATAPQATYEVDIRAVIADYAVSVLGVSVLDDRFEPTAGALYTEDQGFTFDITSEFRFLERDNATGVISQRPDLFTDVSRVCYKTPQPEEALDVTPSVLGLSVGLVRWLSPLQSLRPYCAANEPAFASFMRLATQKLLRCRYFIRAVDGSYSTAGEFLIPDVAPPPSVYQNTLGVGLRNLAAETYVAGAFILPPVGGGYAVQIFDDKGNELSELYEFNYDTRCSGARVRLYWLNTEGGIDAWNFLNKTEEYTSAERTIAQRPIRWSATADAYNPLRHERFVQDIQAEREFTIESEPLETAELEALRGILYSSLAWATISGQRQSVPVVVVASDLITKNANDYETQIISLTLRYSAARRLQLP